MRSLARRSLAGGAAVLAAVGWLAPPAQAAGKVYVVTIRDMAFGPAPVGLKVGDTIEWVNADIFRHTASAGDRSFDVDLAPRAKARTVLTKAGAVTFYCRYHPGMVGGLTVAR